MIKFITNRNDHNVTIPRCNLNECIEYISKLDLIGIDTENSRLNPYFAVPLLLQLGDHNNIYVIDTTSVDISFLKAFESYTFLGQNLKYDYSVLKVNFGIELRNLYDTMIAEQSMGMGSRRKNSLDAITERRLGITATYAKSTRSEFIGATKNFIFEDRHIIYAAEDIKVLRPIYDVQQPIIQNLKMDFVIKEIECKLIPIIADCELEGLNLNVTKWLAKLESNKKLLFEIEEKLDKELEFLGAWSNNPNQTKGGKFSRKRNFIPELAQTNLFGVAEPIKIKRNANLNYGSATQLKDIFKRLELPMPTDKYGKDSVNKQILEKYIVDKTDSIATNFIKLLITYSRISQEIDAFGLGHIKMINPKTNKIHTIYRQCTTVTGRFQSGDSKKSKSRAYHELAFNSQQIPKSNDFRHCFYSEGYDILTIDLASAELIILASLSKDKKLLELQSQDMHSYLANKIYNNLLLEIRKYIIGRGEGIKDYHIKEVQSLLSGSKPEHKITYEQAEKVIEEFTYDAVAITISKNKYDWLRDRVKNVNYGLIYGATAMRVSELLGVSKNNGQIALNTIRGEIPMTFKYLDKIAVTAVNAGYVILSERTKSRRWFSKVLEAKKTKIPLSFKEQGKIEREAKNAPIQGTNAFIIKEAIIKIHEWYTTNNIDMNLLMQVHDELVYRIPKNSPDIADNVKRILRETAELYLSDGLSMGSSMHIKETWAK
jgi:DNA polymerase-1